MCGIAGILTSNQKLISQPICNKMAFSLQHRGPDSSGVWIDNNGLALIHTRLSILDLSDSGHQPMHSSRDIHKAMCVMAGKPVPKWNVPKFIIDIAAKINPKIKYKLDKLFGDECYSSAKIEALGFEAKKTLKDMNEVSF